MRSVFLRYFIRSAILLVACMLALSFSFILSAGRVLEENQREKMEKSALTIRDYLVFSIMPHSPGINWKDAAAIRDVLPAITAIESIYVLISDAEGNILLRTDGEGAPTSGGSLSQPVLHLASQGKAIPAALMRDIFPTAQTTVCKKLIIDNTDITAGYLLVSSSQAYNDRLLRQFTQSWIIVAALGFIVAGISTYITSQRLSRPLRQMAVCAHRFAHGDYSVRADPQCFADGETLELAYAFNAMAESMQKAEDLRRGFIANVSHELKTPMTTIAGFIGGVLDGTIPEDRRQDTLRMVYDEVMRLSRLVVSMTNLTRLQTGQLDLHPRPFDISEMSLRLLLGFEHKINDKDLQVALDVSESGDLWVNADPDSIVQVLTNLLDNAIKFSHPGGNLGMSIRSHGGKAHVRISNQGPEIPPEDLPHIFDRFHKADRSRSHDRTGLGLGLFLVRSILHAHNEDIHVSSQNGETVFSFTLTETKPRQRE